MIIRYALLQVKRISLNVEAWVYQNVPSYTYTHLHIYTHTQKNHTHSHIFSHSHILAHKHQLLPTHIQTTAAKKNFFFYLVPSTQPSIPAAAYSHPSKTKELQGLLPSQRTIHVAGVSLPLLAQKSLCNQCNILF